MISILGERGKEGGGMGGGGGGAVAAMSPIQRRRDRKCERLLDHAHKFT